MRQFTVRRNRWLTVALCAVLLLAAIAVPLSVAGHL